MENPIKMDDLGVPLFSETSMFAGEIQQPPKTDIIRKKNDGFRLFFLLKWQNISGAHVFLFWGVK